AQEACALKLTSIIDVRPKNAKPSSTNDSESPWYKETSLAKRTNTMVAMAMRMRPSGRVEPRASAPQRKKSAMRVLAIELRFMAAHRRSGLVRVDCTRHRR